MQRKRLEYRNKKDYPQPSVYMSLLTSFEVGVVVIGRNEGERLRRSLCSITKLDCPVVYVDSGSTDGSRELASSMGALVVDLDSRVPFTAARARNIGAERLVESAPNLEAIQFVDGDCEVDPDWLKTGAEFLRNTPAFAIVSGQRRELHPHASLYNRLINMEWGNLDAGEVSTCHGDALIRRQAFEEVHGFNSQLIAGEEPDLCLRLQNRGWRIMKLDVPMSYHDAAMTRFSQFWRRARRAGHAYAERAALHPGAPRSVLRPVVSIFIWGLVLPIGAISMVPATCGASLAVLSFYAYLAWKVYRVQRIRKYAKTDAAVYSGFVIVGKFAQVVGVLEYAWNRIRRRKTKLIEYKSATTEV